MLRAAGNLTSEAASSSSVSRSSSYPPITYVYYLAAIFGVLALVPVLQTARILYNRHNLKSLQTAFYALCFFWLLLRCIFFATTLSVSNAAAYFFLYALPTNVQFATFSLLALYLVQRTHYASWKQIRKVAIAVYGITNATLLVVQIALTTAVWNSDDDDVQSALMSFFAVIFLLLVVLLLVYAIKLPKDSRMDPSFPNYPTPWMMSGAAYVIFGIYTFRSIWDVLSATEVVSINIGESGAPASQQALVVVLYIIWEVLPISIVLVLFGAVGAVHFKPLPSSARMLRDEAPVITPGVRSAPPQMLPGPVIQQQLLQQPARPRENSGVRQPLLSAASLNANRSDYGGADDSGSDISDASPRYKGMQDMP